MPASARSTTPGWNAATPPEHHRVWSKPWRLHCSWMRPNVSTWPTWSRPSNRAGGLAALDASNPDRPRSGPRCSSCSTRSASCQASRSTGGWTFWLATGSADCSMPRCSTTRSGGPTPHGSPSSASGPSSSGRSGTISPTTPSQCYVPKRGGTPTTLGWSSWSASSPPVARSSGRAGPRTTSVITAADRRVCTTQWSAP